MYSARIPTFIYYCYFSGFYVHLWSWIQSQLGQSLLSKQKCSYSKNWILRLFYLPLVHLHHYDFNRLWIIFSYYEHGKIFSWFYCYLWSYSEQFLGSCTDIVPQDENRWNKITYHNDKTSVTEKSLQLVRRHSSRHNQYYQNAEIA